MGGIPNSLQIQAVIITTSQLSIDKIRGGASAFIGLSSTNWEERLRLGFVFLTMIPREPMHYYDFILRYIHHFAQYFAEVESD